MRTVFVALCLLAAACAERPVISVTITNSPSTMPDCMGTKGSTGGCR